MFRFGQRPCLASHKAIREEIDRLEKLTAALEVIGLGPLPPEWLLTKAEHGAPILEDWRFAFRPVPCLMGMSTGHPRLPGDRRSIVTSEIFLISEELGWARSYSRWYRLGRRLGDAAGNC